MLSSSGVSAKRETRAIFRDNELMLSITDHLCCIKNAPIPRPRIHRASHYFATRLVLVFWTLFLYFEALSHARSNAEVSHESLK